MKAMKKRRIRRSTVKKIARLSLILLLVLIMLYSGLQVLESTVLRGAAEDPTVPSKTIVRDGVEYFPRQDITTFLVMGIDQYGKVESSDSYNNHGAADALVLLVFDEQEEVCHVLHLNRDTMVEMPVLGVGGKQAGTLYGQLALSHTYGSGLHDSCANTVQAVSDLLYGNRIDHYVAMNMDAIAILNDAVGGVTVEVTEDFSAVDPSIGMGEVTLRGEQAIHFVRTRREVGDQLNISRIERQKEYIQGFVDAFRSERQHNKHLISDAYEEVADYLVSNCTVNALGGYADRFGDYEIGQVISPKGENVQGQEYFEFYVDEEDLDGIILRLLYAPKKTEAITEPKE